MNYVFFVRWRSISQFSSYSYTYDVSLLHAKIQKKVEWKEGKELRRAKYFILCIYMGVCRQKMSASLRDQIKVYQNQINLVYIPYLFYCLHTQFDVKNLLTHLGSIHVRCQTHPSSSAPEKNVIRLYFHTSSLFLVHPVFFQLPQFLFFFILYIFICECTTVERNLHFEFQIKFRALLLRSSIHLQFVRWYYEPYKYRKISCSAIEIS